jgi:hypothetical protein
LLTHWNRRQTTAQLAHSSRRNESNCKSLTYLQG